MKRITTRKVDDLMAKVANELLEEFGSVKSVVKTMKEEVKKRGKRESNGWRQNRRMKPRKG